MEGFFLEGTEDDVFQKLHEATDTAALPFEPLGLWPDSDILLALSPTAIGEFPIYAKATSGGTVFFLSDETVMFSAESGGEVAADGVAMLGGFAEMVSVDGEDFPVYGKVDGRTKAGRTRAAALKAEGAKVVPNRGRSAADLTGGSSAARRSKSTGAKSSGLLGEAPPVPPQFMGMAAAPAGDAESRIMEAIAKFGGKLDSVINRVSVLEAPDRSGAGMASAVERGQASSANLSPGAGATEEARRLLGLGRGNATKPPGLLPKENGRTPFGSVTMPRPVVKAIVSPPLQSPPAAVGTAASGGSGGEERLLERMVQALEGKRTQGGSLESSWGLTQGSASSLEDYEQLWTEFTNGGSAGGGRVPGSVLLERIRTTRRSRSDIVEMATEKALKESQGVQEGEVWSWTIHARDSALPACGNYATLKRTIAILAKALDEGKVHGPGAERGFLLHAYRVMAGAALNPNHEVDWNWPLLGIPDPAGETMLDMAGPENAALSVYHREKAVLQTAMRGAEQGQNGKASGPAAEAETQTERA